MASPKPPDGSWALETLQATLEAALGVARELSGDRLLGRLITAFREMPAQDRAVLIEAIEREVKARNLSRATEAVTGQSMVPNPNARLYLRAHETGFDRNLLERDEMMIATVRAMRVATIIPSVPEIHESWRAAVREAMQHVDQATRIVVEQLVVEMLGFVREANAAEGDAETPTPATPRARRS